MLTSKRRQIDSDGHSGVLILPSVCISAQHRSNYGNISSDHNTSTDHNISTNQGRFPGTGIRLGSSDGIPLGSGGDDIQPHDIPPQDIPAPLIPKVPLELPTTCYLSLISQMGTNSGGTGPKNRSTTSISRNPYTQNTLNQPISESPTGSTTSISPTSSSSSISERHFATPASHMPVSISSVDISGTALNAGGTPRPTYSINTSSMHNENFDERYLNPNYIHPTDYTRHDSSLSTRSGSLSTRSGSLSTRSGTDYTRGQPKLPWIKRAFQRVFKPKTRNNSPINHFAAQTEKRRGNVFTRCLRRLGRAFCCGAEVDN